MQRILSSSRHPLAAPLFLGAVALILTGCSSAKPKAPVVHQRGWIGGQYQVVRQFPPEFKHPPKAALLITALRTNTPAQLAGLSEGDLILELNHQPATRLRSFYRTIDLSQPGTLLPVTAWHDGQTMELEVPVGKETYTKCARLGIGLPPRFAALGLWPNPDFSLVVLGFETESLDTRLDVGSAREKYLKSCGPKNYTAEDKGWNAWLAVLWADVSGQVRSQENVVPPIASQPPIAATAAVGH